ncbi:MAG TPA: hypothetical protein VFN22_00890 [Gemmatimonadales bacterium]|nr:hypothetical protein [Gemmatimonadales bacterium]
MSHGPRTGSLKHSLLRAEGGAVGGLIGAVVVALLFFFEGALHLHQPLAVPSALTSAWFGGVDGSSGAASGLGADVITLFRFLVYTLVHLLTFAAVGASAALVLAGSRFWESVGAGAIYGGAVCTLLLYLVGRLADTPVALDVLGLRRVLLANMLAGAFIGIALYVAEHGDDGNVTG